MLNPLNSYINLSFLILTLNLQSFTGEVNLYSFTGEMYLSISNIKTSKAIFSIAQEYFIRIWASFTHVNDSLKKDWPGNFEKIPWRALWRRALWRNVMLARLKTKHQTLPITDVLWCDILGLLFQYLILEDVVFFTKCWLNTGQLSGMKKKSLKVTWT